MVRYGLLSFACAAVAFGSTAPINSAEAQQLCHRMPADPAAPPDLGCDIGGPHPTPDPRDVGIPGFGSKQSVNDDRIAELIEAATEQPE